jgi:hypothetical protein
MAAATFALVILGVIFGFAVGASLAAVLIIVLVLPIALPTHQRRREREMAEQVIRRRASARVRWTGASYPLGRIKATPEYIQVTAGFARAAIYRNSITAISRRRFLRTRNQFETVDGSGTWVFVYTPTPKELLTDLANRGWPVSA